MALIQAQRYCGECGRMTLHAREVFSTGWGCLLTLLTGGLFLLLWLPLGACQMVFNGYRCQVCGSTSNRRGTGPSPRPAKGRREPESFTLDDDEIDGGGAGGIETFRTNVAGVTFANPDGVDRQDLVEGCEPGDPLTLRREPKNRHDRNAVAVHHRLGQVGYLPASRAKLLAPALDAGGSAAAVVLDVTGDPDEGEDLGLVIGVAHAPAGVHPQAVAAAASELLDEGDEPGGGGLGIARAAGRVVRAAGRSVMDAHRAGLASDWYVPTVAGLGMGLAIVGAVILAIRMR